MCGILFKITIKMKKIKDFIGNELEIGDMVATTSSDSKELRTMYILGFTPTQVKLVRSMNDDKFVIKRSKYIIKIFKN